MPPPATSTSTGGSSWSVLLNAYTVTSWFFRAPRRRPGGPYRSARG